jgi:hypothetical protein
MPMQMSRDIFNERPTGAELQALDEAAPSSLVLPRGAILRTNRGDITCVGLRRAACLEP